MNLVHPEHCLLRTRQPFLSKADKPKLAHAIDEHFNNRALIERIADAVRCTERCYCWRVFDTEAEMKKGRYCKIAKVYQDFTIKHYGFNERS